MKLLIQAAILCFWVSLSNAQELCDATEQSDLKKVVELLTTGANPNEYCDNGTFPLFIATRNNNLELSKLLLIKGANVHQRVKIDPWFSTSLVNPCQEGDYEIVKLLLENGADVNSKEMGSNLTPLSFVAAHGHLDIVKYLVAKGALVDNVDDHGTTPLHYAVTRGHFEVVKYLIEKGADINRTDNWGNFILGDAAKLGHVAILKLLIEKGAKLELKDRNNLTALELAKKNKQIKAIELLESLTN